MTLVLVINLVGYLVAFAMLRSLTRRTGDVFTFAHIFSFVWGLCILSSQIPPSGWRGPEQATLLVLFGAWWAFLFGALLVLQKPLPRTALAYSFNVRALPFVLGGLVLVHAYTWWLESAALGGVWGSLEVRSNLEHLARIRGARALDTKIPWFLQFVRNGFIYYFPLAVLMRRANWIPRWVFGAVIFLGCGMSLVFFTRAPLLWAFTILLVSWTIVYRPALKRATIIAVVAGALFTYVFLEMQALLRGVGSPIAEAHELADPYLGASMRAYETILHGEYPRFYRGFYSLELFYYTADKIGFHFEYPALQREYGLNPTNLYTFLDAYTLDFGIAGAIIGALLTGAFVASAYRLLRTTPRISALIIYCTLVYFCAMATANNEFIRNTLPIIVVFALGLDLLVMGRAKTADRRLIQDPAPVPGPLRTQQAAAAFGRSPVRAALPSDER